MIVAIFGLGYVGLPLALMFAKKYKVIGYDSNNTRISELQQYQDTSGEISPEVIFEKSYTTTSGIGVNFTSNLLETVKASVYIVTVPTPVDSNNRPDLSLICKVSSTIGKQLKKGDTVIYESTVYPGATEEVCVPILETESGLGYNTDFFVGYSPERINPGDKTRPIENIVKVTSGSTPSCRDFVDKLYSSVLTANTHKAESIKIAEAAKVIENTQRDINIAFVNELSKICNLLEIDTHKVLDAAASKWNFLKFTPGLVGGHCIGVDPYYLAQKAQDHGYFPELIRASRKINESMSSYLASQCIKLMLKKNIELTKAKALILGISFKENCADLRNSKVLNTAKELEDYGLEVHLYDPYILPKQLAQKGNFTQITQLPSECYDLVILATPHKNLLHINLRKLGNKNHILFDVKGMYPHPVDGRF